MIPNIGTFIWTHQQSKHADNELILCLEYETNSKDTILMNILK